jgi:hypothetical protein
MLPREEGGSEGETFARRISHASFTSGPGHQALDQKNIDLQPSGRPYDGPMPHGRGDGAPSRRHGRSRHKTDSFGELSNDTVITAHTITGSSARLRSCLILEPGTGANVPWEASRHADDHVYVVADDL